VRDMGKMAEAAKIRVRRVREEALQELKEKEDSGEISEDELFRKKEEIQQMIDEYIQKVNETSARKEQEIMSI